MLKSTWLRKTGKTGANYYALVILMTTVLPRDSLKAQLVEKVKQSVEAEENLIATFAEVMLIAVFE